MGKPCKRFVANEPDLNPVIFSKLIEEKCP
jgi:hypothetical protein